MARVRHMAAGVIAAGLAGMVVTAVSAVPRSLPEDMAPVPLFKSVCTQGTAKLPSDMIFASRFETLPAEARSVTALGAPNTGRAAVSLYSAMPRGEVPNQIYAVGSRGREYLFLPAAGKAGAMASSCAVAWKGTDFSEARRAVLDIAGLSASDEDISYVQDVHVFAVRGNGFTMKAVEMSGWTMLRLTPLGDGEAVGPIGPVPQRAAIVRTARTVPVPGRDGMQLRDAGNGEIVIKTDHKD